MIEYKFSLKFAGINNYTTQVVVLRANTVLEAFQRVANNAHGNLRQINMDDYYEVDEPSKEELKSINKREKEVRIQMDQKIEAACKKAGHKKVRVCYSVYESDKDDVPIDNLDEVAVKGKVVLIASADEFWGGKKAKDYTSDVLVDPTWLEVAVCANKMIVKVRDTHHCFLEDLHLERKEGDITFYSFSMGS